MVRIPVFTVSEGRGVAVTLVLSKRAQGEPLWGATPAVRFQQDAYAAIESAWRAAAVLEPPAALEAHTITVESFPDSLLSAELVMEGPSLAVPMAVGFAALWTGQAWPDRFYSTGNLVRGPGGWRVGPVGGVTNKLTKVPPACLLHVPQGQASGVRTREIVDLDSVWAASGLRPHPGTAFRPGPLRQMVFDGIERARSAHGVHSLAETVHDGISPWYRLGSELRRASDALLTASQAARDQQLAVDGQVWATIALAYAGASAETSRRSLAQARQILADGGSAEARRLRVWLDVLDLAAAITADDWDGGESIARRIEAEPHEGDVSGRALGTAGRFWLHRRRGRDLGRARELLARSVQIFSDEDPEELPRSRIYLAQAWLMGALVGEAGALDRAERELARAADELEPRDGTSYRVTTGMFLDYARARAALAAGRLAEAASLATEARRLSHVWGPSFQVGVLRVLALATGEGRYVAEARAIAGDSTHPALLRKLREAAGEVLDPPEAS